MYILCMCHMVYNVYYADYMYIKANQIKQS